MNKVLSWLSITAFVVTVGVAHAGGDGSASPTQVLAGQAPAAYSQAKTSPSLRAKAAAMKSTPSTLPRKSYVSPTWTRSAIITFYPGSLYQNITRIAHEYGWYDVVWIVPNDYDWVGTTRVAADSLTAALDKALAGYPVQAVFYLGNRVLLIRPRTLR